MPYMIYLALLAIAVCAGLYIVAKYRTSRWMMLTFKPLAMLPVIALSAWALSVQFEWAVLCILLGLLFGLLGDILLLKPNGFKAGLVAFLMGHCWHIPAFVLLAHEVDNHVNWAWVAGYGAFLLVWSIWLLTKIWPVAGKLRWPVVAYFGVIGTMGLTGIAFYSGAPTVLEAQLIAIGATLFIVSDSVLGYERLVAAKWYAPAVISITYYAAQTCFALSTLSLVGVIE